jgi:hypothetical protein
MEAKFSDHSNQTEMSTAPPPSGSIKPCTSCLIMELFPTLSMSGETAKLIAKVDAVTAAIKEASDSKVEKCCSACRMVKVYKTYKDPDTGEDKMCFVTNKASPGMIGAGTMPMSEVLATAMDPSRKLRNPKAPAVDPIATARDDDEDIFNFREYKDPEDDTIHRMSKSQASAVEAYRKRKDSSCANMELMSGAEDSPEKQHRKRKNTESVGEDGAEDSPEKQHRKRKNTESVGEDAAAVSEANAASAHF